MADALDVDSAVETVVAVSEVRGCADTSANNVGTIYSFVRSYDADDEMPDCTPVANRKLAHSIVCVSAFVTGVVW